KISVFNILILSFYIMVIVIPSEFYSVSFQLSYLALLGILVIGNEINRFPYFCKLPLVIRASISASLSALLATSLVSINVFGTLYPVGTLASIVISPIITIFIICGFISIIIPPLLWFLNIGEEMIIYLVNFFSNFSKIDNSTSNSYLIPFIILLIPAILVIIKQYRRIDARRFNFKFKL
ncbi:MAG: ComEC/Rec2 family competence protein, partial [Spirochaetales bacterium]|nr:ComEC/Rec2 family competence protein [Spirochaetales bacterium]